MAASDNVAMEPWVYRPATFADSWISEAFARDTNKALTLALQKSLSNNNNNNNNGNSESGDSEFSRFLNTFQPETTPTPETVSGSDPETVVAAAGTKRERNTVIPVAGGKVAKRKSRASKRTQTTFIAADPVNFRQMVQQVTGMKVSNNNNMSSSAVVKPEPQRLGGARNIIHGGGGGMPTLDTSAFLLDQQQMGVGPASMCYGGARRVEVAEGGGRGGVSGGGLGSFDSFSSFPTLESWKVM